MKMRAKSLWVVVGMAVMTLVCPRQTMAGLKQVHWAPTELTNTIVWLDAADPDTLWADVDGTITATGPVARWDDKSGNSNHMLQANVSYRPQTGSRSISNINAIAFDGNDDTMQAASNAFGSVISNTSVFMVNKFDTTDKDILYLDTVSSFKCTPRYSKWLSLTVNGSVNWGDGWVEWGNPVTNLIGAVGMNELYYSVSDNVFKAYLDCVQQTFNGGAMQRTANGTVATTQGVTVPKFDGLVAEIIILDRTVTDEERQIVEGYLAWKWEFVDKLPADHPYKEEWPNKPPEGMVLHIR